MYSFRIIPVFERNLIITDHAGAIRAMKTFVEDYRLSECRQLLWNLLETALTRDTVYFYEPEHRDEIFGFIRSLEGIIEVIYFLSKNKPL